MSTYLLLDESMESVLARKGQGELFTTEVLRFSAVHSQAESDYSMRTNLTTRYPRLP